MRLVPQRKELTDFEKDQIVALSDLYSHREIGGQLGIRSTTIDAFLSRYVVRETIDNLPHPGAPRKTTPATDRYLVRLAESETRQPLAQLRVQTNGEVSERTIHRRLLEFGIRKWKAVDRSLLMEKHAAQRLQWAKAHQGWTREQWERVAWSDESAVRKDSDPRQMWVFRRQNNREKYDPKNVRPKVKNGRVLQMVWGCFIGTKLGPIAFIDGTVNSDMYIDILKEKFIPFIDVVVADGLTNVVFQQDNATPHVSRKTQKFLDAAAIERTFTVMQWPPNSPDMNLIENLWAHLKTELHKRYPDTLTIQGPPRIIRITLRQRLNEVWWEISEEVLNDLVESMPRRIQALIDIKS